jgi:hypothetical protein
MSRLIHRGRYGALPARPSHAAVHPHEAPCPSPIVRSFQACSAFTRVTACTLALSPIRDTLSEGFSHFVTSIAAPAASGWSVAGWGAEETASAIHGILLSNRRSDCPDHCGLIAMGEATARQSKITALR